MTMKKLFFAFAAGLAVMASCNRQELLPQSVEKGTKAVLNVSISGASASKAASFDEDKVNSLQVFVFNGNQLDVYGNSTSSSLTLNATTGPRTVYALVNAPDLSAIYRMDELKSSISRLSDNAPDKFVMVGSLDTVLAESSSISVDVNRLAARIRLRKLTRNMSSEGLAALDASSFELVRIYAAEVITANSYDLMLPSSSSWKNSIFAGSSIDATDELLVRLPSAPAGIAQGSSYTEDLCVYVYPNPTAADGASVMCTRLVVECKIDGLFYTYPVLIPNVLPNRSYEIKELVLTRLGNQSDGDNDIDSGEHDKIESFSIPFGITIQDWTPVLLGNEGTVTI